MTELLRAVERMFVRTDDDGAARFWAGAVDGMSVMIRSGAVGSRGASNEVVCDSRGQAIRALDRLVAKRVAEGYCEDIASAAIEPALEAAIRADPYDKNAYMVYADWLQAQGDPRGELIALFLANKIHSAAMPLMREHASTLLGPLAVHHRMYDGTNRPAFTWKYGFIHAAQLSHRDGGNDEIGGSLADVLAQLLDHTSGKFLAELTLGSNGGIGANLEDLVGVLVAKAPPSLRVLRIGEVDADVDTTVAAYRAGNLAPLWRALPGLTELHIRAGAFELGDLELPALTRARFKTCGLGAANMRSIAGARWPKLASLAIWFGDRRVGCTTTAKDVGRLLARRDLDALRELALVAAPFADELCAAIPSAPVTARLSRLELSYGALTDTGAQRLARDKDRLAHLDVLDVTGNQLRTAGVMALIASAREVVGLTEQARSEQDDDDDEDDDDRYDDVDE